MKKLLVTLMVVISFGVMAAALKDAKTIGKPFSNAEEWVKVTYDFSKDGGAIADYDVFTADDDIIVTDFYAYGETSVTATPVFDLGVGSGGTGLWSDQTASDLEDGDMAPIDTVGFVKVADGEKMILGIETHAATAGKFIMNFKIKGAE